ncbi:MAG: DUF134 domain-containing protein [Methanomicrobiaceae archaeon]|nr:DUF134 domain-containing protein [Methanomicrobiaceae archaeon]
MNDNKGPERGRCFRGRGRPRAKRIIDSPCSGRRFEPFDETGGESVFILSEEIEVIRLVDLLDHDQEAAAEIMGISRRTVWRDLHSARRKIADALVNGKSIEIIPEKPEKEEL